VLSRSQILESPRVQVIAVESEVEAHGELGLAALEAGKHVHLEKPPAENLADLRKMVEIARRKKLLLQMGYMWRHHPGMHAIFEAVRRGWLGDVYMIRGQMNTLIEAKSRVDWARFRGGQMFEQGCHLIDAIVRLMGRPAKVTPFLRHDGNFEDSLADNTVAVFEWARCVAVITHSVLQPNAGQHRMFEVMSSNGTATLKPIEGPPTLVFDLARPAGPYAKGRQEVKLPPYSRYVGDMEELARCFRSGSPLSVTLEQELDVQEALLNASRMA
jgi:predicted dehydrogenase